MGSYLHAQRADNCIIADISFYQYLEQLMQKLLPKYGCFVSCFKNRYSILEKKAPIGGWLM